MAYSETKCRDIAAKIKQFEDAIDDFSLEGGVTQISDGSQTTGFTPTSLSRLKNRLDHYKRLYDTGQCAVVLGNNDVDTKTARGNIRPVIGYK